MGIEDRTENMGDRLLNCAIRNSGDAKFSDPAIHPRITRLISSIIPLTMSGRLRLVSSRICSIITLPNLSEGAKARC